MDAFEMFELEKLRPLIERCQLQEHRCIICGSPTTGFGVFTPDNERNFRLGAPTGKTRYVAYGLSHLHSSVPTDVIEAALANDFHKYVANITSRCWAIASRQRLSICMKHGRVWQAEWRSH